MLAIRHIHPLRVSLIVLLAALSSESLPCARAGFTNEDYKQLNSAQNATNFEFVYKGDFHDVMAGGAASSTNPFANGTSSTSLNGNGNTVVQFSGSDSIPADATKNRHFGVTAFNFAHPKLIDKYWTYPSAPTLMAVPFVNTDILWFPNHTATVTVSNTSSDTVTVTEAGFLVSATQVPLEQLNRTFLPPLSFSALASLDGQYLPGQSQQVTLNGINVTDSVITYNTVQYSGASSGNPYNSTGGEWREESFSAPEPAALSLLGIGTLCLLGCAWRQKQVWANGTRTT